MKARAASLLPLLLISLAVWLPAQNSAPKGLPSDPRILEHMQQAVGLHKSGDLENAAAEYQQVINASPSFAEAYMNLGLVRHQQKQYEAAISLFRHALQ